MRGGAKKLVPRRPNIGVAPPHECRIRVKSEILRSLRLSQNYIGADVRW